MTFETTFQKKSFILEYMKKTTLFNYKKQTESELYFEYSLSNLITTKFINSAHYHLSLPGLHDKIYGSTVGFMGVSFFLINNILSLSTLDYTCYSISI